jgi:hypothetical protein
MKHQSSSPDIEQPWRYEIQHGPDGETDYAWVYDENNNLVCTTKTHYAIAIVNASLETPFCVQCGSAEGCDAAAATPGITGHQYRRARYEEPAARARECNDPAEAAE